MVLPLSWLMNDDAKRLITDSDGRTVGGLPRKFIHCANFDGQQHQAQTPDTGYI